MTESAGSRVDLIHVPLDSVGSSLPSHRCRRHMVAAAAAVIIEKTTFLTNSCCLYCEETFG